VNKALAVILAAVTIDAIGIGLIIPILPKLLESVAHSTDVAILFGMMLAIYSAMQFLFSPALGVLSDRFGRRPVLLVSLAGAAIDYVVLAIAPEIWMLVVGRAIAGLTSANMAVATAYLTDITPEAQRARRFGYFHAMFGVGFIIGPVLGGWLGEHWVRAPFLAAAALNALNFALALFVLPESRPGQRIDGFKLRQLNPLGSLGWALTKRALLPMIAIFLIMNFVGNMYGTVWVLFGQDAYGWGTFTIGLSFAAFGLFHAGAQLFLVGPVARWAGERWALIIGFAAEATSLVILAFATHGWVMFAIMPLFAVGGVGMPALQSLATAQVDSDNQGRLQGVLASVVSLASVFGPLFFSTAYFTLRPDWPGAIWLVGCAVYALAVPLMFGVRKRAPAAVAPRVAKVEPKLTSH